MTALQPDLFGEIDAADFHRKHLALRVLAEAHRLALEILIGTRPLNRGEIKQNANGPYAYSSRPDGFYVEDRHEWSHRGGWSIKPAHRVTWDELADLTAGDPRLPEIRAWAERQTRPDSWRSLRRPFELDVDGHTWHPSYVEADHEDPGWPERLHAWKQTIAVYQDAAARLEAL